MVTLNVNGKSHLVDAPADMPLLWAIRDLVGLTGTKYGCGIAQCGACRILLDGESVPSCQTFVGDVEGAEITTIEGIAEHEVGARVQQAWLDVDVVQCGYCQSGQIISATALLEANPNPSDADIDEALDIHICRCGTYPRIRQALKIAAQS